MIFTELSVRGAYSIEIEPAADDRGFFARTWSAGEMAAHGMSGRVDQCSISHNRKRGTLRGMHFQAAPAEESKYVSCARGALYDVVLDLRPGSPTYKRWTAMELTAENRRMLYVPPGCAHGFQTLEDDTDVFYQISPAFVSSLARGVRWDDPAFAIQWPLADHAILSERDRSFPAFAG